MYQKGLLTKIGEVIDEHRAARHVEQENWQRKPFPIRQARGLHWLLPTPGNVIFTLLVIGSLLWAQNAGAISLGAPAAATASTGTIAYQGRLADASGSPLTQTVNMIFRLYAAASGGTPLWEEQWTGANSVQVSDGLFNVMLGSLTPIPQNVVTDNANLFLGITVGTDSEMAPRVQLGSVPFAVQALTVPDGSITKAKLASGISFEPPDGSITAAKLAPDLFQVQTASTSTEYWPVPECGPWQQIAGLQLSLTLARPQKTLLDFTGLAKNPGAGESIYTNIFIDDNLTTVASGRPLLGGCTNGTTTSGDTWCTVANSLSAILNAGTHTIDVRVSCDGAAADAKVDSGSLRAVVLP